MPRAQRERLGLGPPDPSISGPDLPCCLFCLSRSAELHTKLTGALASYARESKGGNRVLEKCSEKGKRKERNWQRGRQVEGAARGMTFLWTEIRHRKFHRKLCAEEFTDKFISLPALKFYTSTKCHTASLCISWWSHCSEDFPSAAHEFRL